MEVFKQKTLYSLTLDNSDHFLNRCIYCALHLLLDLCTHEESIVKTKQANIRILMDDFFVVYSSHIWSHS